VLSSLRDGFRSLARNWGLVALVLLANLAFALVLAVPLAVQLEATSPTSRLEGMMYGFDYDWWSAWSEKQEGPSSALSPDILAWASSSRTQEGLPTPSILGLGALYLLLQVFLTGGLLGVFRSRRGAGPCAASSTGRASTSEGSSGEPPRPRRGRRRLRPERALRPLGGPDRAGGGLGEDRARLDIGRHALLVLVLVLVHMVASHAKVKVVREERLSAVLAFLSSLGFCARNLLAALASTSWSAGSASPSSSSSGPSTPGSR